MRKHLRLSKRTAAGRRQQKLPPGSSSGLSSSCLGRVIQLTSAAAASRAVRPEGRATRGGQGRLMPRERVAPQSEVIRVLVLEDSPCCGGARTSWKPAAVLYGIRHGVRLHRLIQNTEADATRVSGGSETWMMVTRCRPMWSMISSLSRGRAGQQACYWNGYGTQCKPPTCARRSAGWPRPPARPPRPAAAGPRSQRRPAARLTATHLQVLCGLTGGTAQRCAAEDLREGRQRAEGVRRRVVCGRALVPRHHPLQGRIIRGDHGAAHRLTNPR